MGQVVRAFMDMFSLMTYADVNAEVLMQIILEVTVALFIFRSVVKLVTFIILEMLRFRKI